MTSTSVSLVVRAVNAASAAQSVHTAVNFVTFSAKGTSCRMELKGLRWNVASSAATMTVLPVCAHFSQ